MVDHRHSRHQHRRRMLLRGIWLVWASIALHVNMGDAGRPFRTEDNDTVPLGSFELEVAADLAFERSDHSHVLPALSFKVGVADRVEMGFEGGYQFVRIEGMEEAGLTETALKVKVRFYDGAAVIPSIGTTVAMILPTADRDINPSRDLGFLAIAQLSGDLQAFTYFVNLGLTLAEDPREGRNRLKEDLLWGVAVEIPVRQDISLAVDFFGETQQGNGVAQSGLFGGIWRSPWQIDFDLAVIVGMTRSADDVGLTFGLTYQFPVFAAGGPQQASRRAFAKSRRARQPGSYGTDRTSTNLARLAARGL
jgi:hypothetical protein